KIHFRVVFAELGEPIFDLKKLSDILETLEHALKGLEYMHRAGWVHRDISAGNVLRCGHQGKIADLEYAKALNLSGESHDVRTTSQHDMRLMCLSSRAHFMACEVEGQRYLCLSDPSMLPEGDGAPIVPFPHPFVSILCTTSSHGGGSQLGFFTIMWIAIRKRSPLNTIQFTSVIFLASTLLQEQHAQVSYDLL
ncbi:hypothetical protein L210DRAFT_3723668, partial [Boletus edulis BED1]